MPAPVTPPPRTTRSYGGFIVDPFAGSLGLSLGLHARADLDVEVGELLVGDGGGGAGHEIGPLLGLRVGDDVAQRIGAAQEHGQAVDAGRDAAVRRRAVL